MAIKLLDRLLMEHKGMDVTILSQHNILSKTIRRISVDSDHYLVMKDTGALILLPSKGDISAALDAGEFVVGTYSDVKTKIVFYFNYANIGWRGFSGMVYPVSDQTII